MGYCRATPKPIWLVYMGGVVMASVRYHAAGLLMVRIIDKVWFGGDEFFFLAPQSHLSSPPLLLQIFLLSCSADKQKRNRLT